MKRRVIFVMLLLCFAAISYCFAAEPAAKPYVAVNSWKDVVKQEPVPAAIKNPPYYSQLPDSILLFIYKNITGEAAEVEAERKLCFERQLQVMQAAMDNNVKAIVPSDSFKDSDVTSSKGTFVKSKAIKSPIEHAGADCSYACYGSLKSIAYAMTYCKHHGAADCPAKEAMLKETNTVVEPAPRALPNTIDIIVGVVILLLIIKSLWKKQTA